ncbi:MAG TPA: PepSY domain-containing protein [Candidatus Polarisedimenticolaceae bacterium]|nr:PepSY domain-containing protein [Candidatus Polarisedimenticolaceae bacterium]
MKLFHKILFWSHLIAAVVAGAVIFLMSATGVILMYEHQIVEYAEREQRSITPPAGAAMRLSLDELVAKARVFNTEGRATSLVLRNEPTASIAIAFGRDGTVYVNPYTGAVLGKESKLHDWFHDVTDWHRWLGREGEGRATARAITGACNLAFFWLSITGVYLWWPRSWHWRGLKSSLLFNSGLRGKARDWNWHNVIGFWSSSVLVVLTLTAAVMSYPRANDLLYTLTGSEPPPRAQGPAPGGQAQQRRGEGEARERKSMASFDAFFARAQQQAHAWTMMMMRLPPPGDGPVTVMIQEPSAPHMFARSQLTLNRSSAEILKWEPYAAARTGRKLRVWVRGLHTGEAFGFVGQTVAGLASLGGCFLVWTGFAMAWRRFRYRNRHPERMGERSRTEQDEIHSAVQTTGQITETPIEVVKIAMEQINSYAVTGRAHNRPEEVLDNWKAAHYDKDSLLMLYGSVTGTAEMLAHKLAAALSRAGHLVQVRDMAQCEPHMLTHANYVLLVVSTYGDGEPPDDAVSFWQSLVHGNKLDLRGVKFSVLALGNRTFDHFCRCGREFDAALERHGAIRIYPRVDCDVDYEAPAKRWLEGVLAHLLKDKPAMSA